MRRKGELLGLAAAVDSAELGNQAVTVSGLRHPQSEWLPARNADRATRISACPGCAVRPTMTVTDMEALGMVERADRPADRGSIPAGRRSVVPLAEFTSAILLLVGLLVILPINNTVEYGYFDRLVGPLGMLDNVGTIIVVVLGALWYGLAWRLIDRGVYSTIRSDRVLLAAVIWSAAAYLWLWWLCSGCMGPTGERTAIALLGFAMPTISYYLIQSARRNLERWRDPAKAPARSWVRRRRVLYASVGGVVLLGGLLFYFLQVRPFLRFRSLDSEASPKEVRDACHQVLWIPVDAHDAFLTLAAVGDESSVPRLISAL